MTEHTIERIAELRGKLEDLLEVLASPTSDDVRIASASARCEDGFRALGDLEELWRGVAPEERARVRMELQEIARLNAVAANSVQEQKDAVERALCKTRDGRRSFTYYTRGGDTGRSCDLSG